jgi:xanthine dehydrogenase YagR molybdenum-binding subunit
VTRLAQDAPPRPAAPGKKWIQTPVVVNGQESYEWTEVDDTVGATWPARDELRLLDHDLRRVDGPEKVSGKALFAHDRRAPGMLWARLLCCPHPSARVTLDLEPARALPGVQHVRSLLEGEGVTRYLGQPIAAVAADTPELADDALRAIRAQYEVLPFAVTPAQATAAGAPQVTQRGNVREGRTRGEQGATLAALDGCAASIDATYSVPVQHHACLETHGLMVDYRGGDEATVYVSTQGTFAAAGDVPGALGLEPGGIVVQVPYMGGGFGSKFGIGVEGQTACAIARELKRPVHLLLTRQDEFLIAGNRSAASARVRAGVDGEGRLLAFHADIDQYGGLGRGSHAGLPYVYTAAQHSMVSRSVHSHLDASRAFRAPGHPQASFAMEAAMDELAYAAGIDLLEIRLLNLPEDGREAWERQLERAAREIGWDAHPHRSAWDKGNAALKVGIGFGVSVWGGGGGAGCEVDVRIDKSGAVSALSGSQDLGTGTRTYVGAIVAEVLGLEAAAVGVRIGDSRLGQANGSGGSTTTASLAPAVYDAARAVRDAFAARLAPELGAEASALVFAGGEVRAGARKLAWRESCAVLGPDGLSARGVWKPGLSGTGVHGAVAAKVEVDTLTGAVRVTKMVAVQDCGLPLNRLALVSQMNGGMIQALSYGLFEERVMDADLGLMLNANFGDYKLAGCREMPELVALIDDEDTRQEVIGMAEPAVIAGQSAIANAVQNACGVRVRALPITCDKVLMGLADLGAADGGKS